MNVRTALWIINAAIWGVIAINAITDSRFRSHGRDIDLKELQDCINQAAAEGRSFQFTERGCVK